MILNVVCWGTGLQQAKALPGGRTSAEVTRAMADLWFRPFGVPEVIVTDQGPEFGEHWQDYMNER
eukprot:3558462-Alexandrium_andersonii.AAC.1